VSFQEQRGSFEIPCLRQVEVYGPGLAINRAKQVHSLVGDPHGRLLDRRTEPTAKGSCDPSIGPGIADSLSASENLEELTAAIPAALRGV
jgi:hypothetical protein